MLIVWLPILHAKHDVFMTAQAFGYK